MKTEENHSLYFLLLIFCAFSLGAQNQFYPPHWFQGLKETKLEIMVYNEQGFSQEAQVRLSENLPFTVYRPSGAAGSAKYIFINLDLKGFAKAGFEVQIEGSTYNYQLKQANAHRPQPLVPSDAIYLITADRFANGDPKNDVSKNMNETKYGRKHDFGRHGGDLQGVTNHLDYIQEMGFTATWTSPVMTNDEFKESYHGYAITNHYEVDPRLGGEQAFRSYVEASHARGMKVVLDVVYNHTGSQHFLNLNPPDSSFFHYDMMHTRSNFRAVNVMDPHASKADVKKFSEGWFDDHMPDVNQKQPQFANYLIQNSLFWILEYGLDAFRIDTYAYPDQSFMAELARRIKLERPNFFMFGEIWVHYPEIQSYFAGGNPYNPNDSRLDAVTDFQFRYALKESLDNTQSWTGGVAKLYYRLAADHMYSDPSRLITFIDNHDEPRIFGELHGNINKMKVALGVLYTMRGIPCTYYGTEILMQATEHHGVIREDFPGGFKGDALNKFDPSNLKGQEAEVNAYMRKLLAWRAKSLAITQGSFLHFVPENDVYVYFRIHEGETVMVVINTHPNDNRIVDLNRFREVWSVMDSGYDVLTGEPGPMDSLEMEPMSIRIFSRTR
jgi:glycosidase